MKVIEGLGFLFGYVIGILTGFISLLRHARVFHPRGHLYEAEIIGDGFPKHAMVRLSSAWWKEVEWPDALGIAVRFTKTVPYTVHPFESDQDLLFASFSRPWEMLLSPFFTDYKNFLTNYYYAISPFIKDGELIKYELHPGGHIPRHGNREEKLVEAVLENEAVFELHAYHLKRKSLNPVATIRLIRPLNYDQEELRFNPFQNGMGIRPYGFLQYMRIGAYQLSQLARPRRRMNLEKTIEQGP